MCNPGALAHFAEGVLEVCAVCAHLKNQEKNV